MVYVIGFISLIASFIYLVWKIETYIPSLQKPAKGVSIDFKELIEWFKLLGEKKKYNGVVALFRGEEELFQCCLGYRDAEQKYRIDTHTRFRLASVSKQFTAFGMMVLLKKFQFKEKYDTLVSDILEEFPYQNVSIRHLLNHTSGIEVDYMALAKGYRNGEKEILTIQKALNLICSEQVVKSVSPATRFSYNNTNYVVLAGLIERISEVSFEEFMRKEVFEPLELSSTLVWNLTAKTPFAKLENVAVDFEQYLNTKPRVVEPDWIDGVSGDGGIFSSLHDLKKWMSMIESNPLLSQEEMNEAFQIPILKNGDRTEYGFGWVIQRDMIWHDGKWLATNSFIMKNRISDMTLVMIDNSNNLRFDKILYSIKESVFKNEQE